MNFSGEDFSRRCCVVDIVGFDGDKDIIIDFEELVGVYGNNMGLVRLSNIGEDDIDYGDDYVVVGRLMGIFNNRDDIGVFGSYGDEIVIRVGREFDSVDVVGGIDKVGNVGDGGIGGGIEVEDVRVGFYVDVVGIISDGGIEFVVEGVLYVVFDFGGGCGVIVVFNRFVDGDVFFVVDRFVGG